NEAETKEYEQQDRSDLDQNHDVVGPCGLAYAAHQHDRKQQHDQERGDIESRVPTCGVDIPPLQILQAEWQISWREPLRRERYPDPVQQRHYMRRKANAYAHV